MRFGTSRWRRSGSGNGRIRADDGLESIDGRPSERFSTVIVEKEVSNGHRGGYRIDFPVPAAKPERWSLVSSYNKRNCQQTTKR